MESEHDFSGCPLKCEPFWFLLHPENHLSELPTFWKCVALFGDEKVVFRLLFSGEFYLEEKALAHVCLDWVHNDRILAKILPNEK